MKESIALDIFLLQSRASWRLRERLEEGKVLTEAVLMNGERGEQPIPKMEMLRAEPGAEPGFLQQLGPRRQAPDPAGDGIRTLWATASFAISIRIEEKNAVTLIHLQGGDS